MTLIRSSADATATGTTVTSWRSVGSARAASRICGVTGAAVNGWRAWIPSCAARQGVGLWSEDLADEHGDYMGRAGYDAKVRSAIKDFNRTQETRILEPYKDGIRQ